MDEFAYIVLSTVFGGWMEYGRWNMVEAQTGIYLGF
jgi:hypothetical protein